MKDLYWRLPLIILLRYLIQDIFYQQQMNQTCQYSTQDEFENTSSINSCESCHEEPQPKRGKAKKNKSGGKSKQSFKVKVKTEICKYWAIEGYCPYGKQCAFAHGKHEVREKTHVPQNYKTKTCKNFTQAGYCCYGERCQFKHPDKKGNKLPQLLYSMLLQNMEQLIQGKSKLPRRSKGLPKLH